MIHPTAIIDPTAQIAESCEIGPYSVVGANVTIGEGSWIGPHVVLKGPTTIGKNNKIYQFASIGEDPQDLKYDGEPTQLVIGDNNTIREYATINRGTVGGGNVTSIGNNNLLMAYIHVAHDCRIANNVVFSNGASLAGHVNVNDYAILAGFSCVHQFCSVGEHAFVGLNSVVNKDVPPYMMAVGNYAEAKGINKNGLRRREFSDDTISALHRAYMALVRKKGEREAAVNSLKAELKAYPEVKNFLSFIETSERGIVR